MVGGKPGQTKKKNAVTTDKTSIARPDATLLSDIFNTSVGPSLPELGTHTSFHLNAQSVTQNGDKKTTTFYQLRGVLHERTALVTFSHHTDHDNADLIFPQQKQFLANTQNWDSYKQNISFDVNQGSQEKFSAGRGITLNRAEDAFLTQIKTMKDILDQTNPQDMDLVFAAQDPNAAMMIWFYKTYLIKPMRQAAHVEPRTFRHDVPGCGSAFSGKLSENNCTITFHCQDGDTLLSQTYRSVTKKPNMSLAEKALHNIIVPFALDKTAATQPLSVEQQSTYTQNLKKAQAVLVDQKPELLLQ